MSEQNKNTFVNVDFSNFPELLADLEEMVKKDDSDRSKFIRKLVRQEKARRQQLALPLPTTNRTRKPSATMAA